MECEEKIYSEEYQDYIIEYFGSGESIPEDYNTSCYQLVSNRFAVVYPESGTVEANLQNGVFMVPRVYGLLSSTQTLEATGVSRVRRLPGLNLYGRGVMIGIVDTGAGVLL